MTDLPNAKTRPASNWSAIWILPLIALAIGGWLGWRAYSQTGIDIEVHFSSGAGIVANKTEVVYKGMPIGKVKALKLDNQNNTVGVVATIEMNKDVEDSLRSDTQFWLVKPSVSLAGITGLDTLVSGNYIAARPGQGEPSRKFTALPEAPPLSDARPGLHLTLKAARLGSLNRGSPIFYKQIQVGQVKSYELSSDQSTLDVKVFIEPAYANLVHKGTRFWNASGISIDASLAGVKVRSESLSSIVSGGIAFATPDHDEDGTSAPDTSQPYRLYEDFDAAQEGILVKVKLSDFEGLQADHTPVMYKGIQVGTLKSLKINPDLSGAEAQLNLDPLSEDYLVKGTDFWVVKPSISLAGITGIEALVKGNYIAIRPGEKGGEPQREFEARAKAPPLDLRSPGLHLVLFSDRLGSLDVGSPILYKQVQVGTVQSYQFSKDRQHVVLGVHIEKDYADLVNSSTRFWNSSGVTVSGGLTGIEVKSESLQTLIAGGVTFETPDLQASLNQQIPRFDLYTSREDALQAGTKITISVAQADGLHAGTPIRFKGLDVGKVGAITLSKDLQSVLVTAQITLAEQQIARAGTQFWVVKPELGLIRTANLETLVSGQYLEVRPAAKSSVVQKNFTALDRPPEVINQDPGLRLTLSAPRRGSLKAGVPVTYREVAVGKVTGFELGQNADRVLVSILIEPRFAPLVHTGSRFWNSSGFNLDFGLLKGATVRTESLESLAEGGIAFATPEDKMGSQAIPGQTFALYDESQEDWLKWAPKINIGK